MENQPAALLTVPQFAALLNVTPACIRRWLLERRIACVKIGGRLVRIPIAERDRIIETGFRPAREDRSRGRGL
jgi:excisionase family DNA binding protein